MVMVVRPHNFVLNGFELGYSSSKIDVACIATIEIYLSLKVLNEIMRSLFRDSIEIQVEGKFRYIGKIAQNEL